MELDAYIIAVLDPQDVPAGAAFLVQPDLALTCAHVVQQARSGPGQSIWLQLPQGRGRIAAEVDAQTWPQAAASDVALLRLKQPVHDLVLPLGDPDFHNLEVAFQSYGFPAAGSINGGGQIVGSAEVGGQRVLQLRSPEVTTGFSGAPVWAPVQKCVVGMIVSISRPDSYGRLATSIFAVPGEVLRSLCGLPAAVRNRRVNPFGRLGMVDDPEYYFVRHMLTDEIFTELKKGQSLAVIADAQSGKSSLLWYIRHAGPTAIGRQPEDFVRLDLQLVRSDEDYYEELCQALGIATCRGNRLGRALRGRKIVLCLDEMEKMTWGGFTADLRAELRDLADGANAPLTLVIASRKPLEALFPDGQNLTSPLANVCHKIHLPNFSLEEAQVLARMYLTQAGAAGGLNADEIAQAWSSSQGHPGSLQQALKTLFDHKEAE